MKVAIVLLVCFVAVASAAAPTTMDKTQWENWATSHKDPDASIEVKVDTTNIPTTDYIISDAGSGNTRLIIGVVGQGEVTVEGLHKVVTPDPSDTSTPKKPLVLKAFKDVLASYANILFIGLGATAGARNDMWLNANTDAVTRIGYLCSSLKPNPVPSGKKWECGAGIIQGTTEGFLGWYQAWQKSSKPPGFCYMEFGGMSTQIAASVASAPQNVVGNLNGDSIKVGVVSGMQLGFNVIGDSTLNTAGNTAAAKVLTECDPYDQVRFNFANCKTAVQAFLAKDTDLNTCLKTGSGGKGYAAQFKNVCAATTTTDPATPGVFVRKGAPWKSFLLSSTSQGVVGDLPSSADFSTIAECKKKPATDVKPTDAKNTFQKPWFACARLIMWNEFMTSIFGSTVPKVTKIDGIEWFDGFKAIMNANKFDGALMDVFMTGNGVQSQVTHAVSDCVDITGTTGFPLDSTRQRLRLHARGGRRMNRISGLRLKF